MIEQLPFASSWHGVRHVAPAAAGRSGDRRLLRRPQPDGEAAGRDVVQDRYRPEGWPCVVPRIFVEDPAALVGFVGEVFEATGSYHPERPSEIWIGGSLLMIASALEREAAPAFLYVYVLDTDRAFQRALALGAECLEEPADMHYGDRRAMIRDPWGNRWQLATHRGRFTP